MGSTLQNKQAIGTTAVISRPMTAVAPPPSPSPPSTATATKTTTTTTRLLETKQKPSIDDIDNNGTHSYGASAGATRYFDRNDDDLGDLHIDIDDNSSKQELLKQKQILLEQEKRIREQEETLRSLQMQQQQSLQREQQLEEERQIQQRELQLSQQRLQHQLQHQQAVYMSTDQASYSAGGSDQSDEATYTIMSTPSQPPPLPSSPPPPLPAGPPPSMATHFDSYSFPRPPSTVVPFTATAQHLDVDHNAFTSSYPKQQVNDRTGSFAVGTSDGIAEERHKTQLVVKQSTGDAPRGMQRSDLASLILKTDHSSTMAANETEPPASFVRCVFDVYCDRSRLNGSSVASSVVMTAVGIYNLCYDLGAFRAKRDIRPELAAFLSKQRVNKKDGTLIELTYDTFVVWWYQHPKLRYYFIYHI